jgi:hypothetical protein
MPLILKTSDVKYHHIMGDNAFFDVTAMPNVTHIVFNNTGFGNGGSNE